MDDWRHNAAACADILARAAAALAASPVRVASAVRLPARGRLLVTGDVHDNRVHFEAAVRAARLDASADHHLVVQEIIHGEGAVDGVDMSHRLLVRVAELVLDYPAQVHPILANHEIAQFRGHGITKGGVHCTQAFDMGLTEAYGDDATQVAEAVGRFIAAMPLAVVCANGAMVSHSLPGGAGMRFFDTRVLERVLFDEDFDPPYGAAHLLTWGRMHSADQLEQLAREWGVRVFIAGHEPAPEGVLVRPPNMVILNTGHAAGRVIDLDLAVPAPWAAELAATAVPVSLLLPSQVTPTDTGERLA
jgi:hypothetical protein